MAGNRDTNKRLKAIGIPIELCVKYERMCGIPPGKKLSFTEKFRVSEAMISALEAGARNIMLTSEDYQLIAQEVKRNEASRKFMEMQKTVHEVFSGNPDSEGSAATTNKGGKRK